jgi:hypothetical protein
MYHLLLFWYVRPVNQPTLTGVAQRYKNVGDMSCETRNWKIFQEKRETEKEYLKGKINKQ